MKGKIAQLSFFIDKKIVINLKPMWSNIICSISGGQDSIILFFYLYLRHQLKILLYCHHFWQIESFHIVNELFRLAYITKLQYIVVVPEKQILSEECGRFWRFKILFGIQNFTSFKKFATGHTSSDTLETIYWKLLRGTSFSNILQTAVISDFIKEKTLPQKSYCFSFDSEIEQYKSKNIINSKFWNRKKSWSINRRKFKNCVYEVCMTVRIPSLNRLINENEKSKSFDILEYFLIKNKTSSEKSIQLIKPLVKLRRDILTSIILEESLPIFPDRTNNFFKITRNSIRKFLFPLIRYYFQRSFEPVFERFIEITTLESDYFKKQTIFLVDSSCRNLQFLREFQEISPVFQYRFLKIVLRSYTNQQPKYLHILLVQKNI